MDESQKSEWRGYKEIHTIERVLRKRRKKEETESERDGLEEKNGEAERERKKK